MEAGAVEFAPRLSRHETSMARVVWKDGHVLSIETRTGHYALAQMTREPFLVFFDAFSTDNKWRHIDLATTSVLFCKAVTRQFLQCSNIAKQRNMKPLHLTDLPTRWIHKTPESRKVRVWPGTQHEREFIWIGEGGSLVEKDVLRHKGGPYAHPSGVFDRIIIESIAPSDSDTIDRHEIDSLAVFPATNERLFLCHTLGRNADPDKDILFNRDLPLDYATYIDVIRGGTAEELVPLKKLYAFEVA
jgi:hypothetical protein